METNEVRQFWEMLFGLLERGPWKDPKALGDATSILVATAFVLHEGERRGIGTVGEW